MPYTPSSGPTPSPSLPSLTTLDGIGVGAPSAAARRTWPPSIPKQGSATSSAPAVIRNGPIRYRPAPSVGTEDPGKLACHADKEGVYHLHLCEVCRRYLKAIDPRKVRGKVFLPVERVLTVRMDKVAVLGGYLRS